MDLTTIDVRGLSCPEPVLKTQEKMNEGKKEIGVLIDTEVALENIINLAEKNGWKTETQKKGEEYILILKKV